MTPQEHNRMPPTVYIETMGCQMNKLDSELVLGQLQSRGFTLCDQPEAAEVIIFNTCSVRQHAEEKVLSKLGQLRRRHQSDKQLTIAVIGCMAQRFGEALQREAPQVDIVCGPNSLYQLPQLIDNARKTRQQQLALNPPSTTHGINHGPPPSHDCRDHNDDRDRDDCHDCHQPSASGRGACSTETVPDPAPLDQAIATFDSHRLMPTGQQRKPFMAFVRAMRGCNNFCSYCIVPYVRGREASRPLAEVVNESRRLVEAGVKEITLLGQAVNAYHDRSRGHDDHLADLLEAVHAIDGLERLRFVTNYPTDITDPLLQAMAELPKVCEYLHVCAQSGSNRILRAMNRHYTAEQYFDMVDRARSIVPGMTIAGDFIVGFPGETDEDFNATAEMIRRVRYKNCFIFKYSPRPGTRAARELPDDVPDAVKRERNIALLELQNSIAHEDNQRLVGQATDILVEGTSKNPHLNQPQHQQTTAADTARANTGTASRQPAPPPPGNAPFPQLVGRTRGDRIVVFYGPRKAIGQVVTVTITAASALTLFAELTEQPTSQPIR